LVVPQVFLGVAMVAFYYVRMWKRRTRLSTSPAKVAFLGVSAVLYTLSPPIVFGIIRGNAIRDGWGTYVRVAPVRQLDSLVPFADSTLMLLGTSESYLFLLERSSGHRYIIPSANVAVLRLCSVRRGWRPLKHPDRVCAP
jgi:hypothetical protein